MTYCIRGECPDDSLAIRQVTDAAFQRATRSNGREGVIVDDLRGAGALTVSLVATSDGRVVGHIAFSPVLIDGRDEGWFGLGPVSVLPEQQRRGIGAALITDGLARLKARGARGCVVLGEPSYYQRFGFKRHPAVRYADAPPEYFLNLSFDGASPSGCVTYHNSFSGVDG
ncbi:GNAT family N-acetyltransferase [Tahibacter amnicola]|uniref:N-acetyltransferase n=1 Tax=Tahibacter amnicola TaxID=2976241 RepID=A0ABY6B7U4_9GAMM|nr:N-acetyltransferase [Tahibacter amnicola]UXI65837.1 N-acetyltransferase [Tahibacter amnicola]